MECWGFSVGYKNRRKSLAEAGIEPARGVNPHGILSPVRLPIPPLGRVGRVAGLAA